MNELVIDQFHDEINKIDSIKFVNWNRRHIFDSEKAYFLRNIYNLNVKFSPDLTKGIYGGGTVTFAALQLCYFLGFKTVIIIGLDHNYKETGIPNKSEIRQNDKDESHFDPNYFPKGIKWQIPDLVTSEFAYKVARDYFEKNGKRIIDATIGGKCNVFEKKDFKSLF